MIAAIVTAVHVAGFGFALPLLAVILYARFVAWMYGTVRGPMPEDEYDE